MVELVLYAGFVSAYFFLILHFLGSWVRHVFADNKTLYAMMALTLMIAQGSLLEMFTSGLSRVIRNTQAIIQPLRRMTRPHETITRPPDVPGLLVYRFAGPLIFFNATHFSHRVMELIDTAKPTVTFFLINAEAIVDIDTTAQEILEELYNTLEIKGIALGLCEVKGHFQEVLMSTHLPHRAGFILYPSVAAAIRALTRKRLKKDTKAASV